MKLLIEYITYYYIGAVEDNDSMTHDSRFNTAVYSVQCTVLQPHSLPLRDPKTFLIPKLSLSILVRVTQSIRKVSLTIFLIRRS